jgi:glycogen debranching enzyme
MSPEVMRRTIFQKFRRSKSQMRVKVMMKTPLLCLLLVCSAFAQAPSLASASSRAGDMPHIQQRAIAADPFSVAGPHGALLGTQDGRFEAWIYPWKIFDNLRISARMQDYDVPLDVNAHASQIGVEPDRTTITYSHANFTIRQIMVAPQSAPAHAGVLVFYQIEAIRPMTLTFSLHPVMQPMWPAKSEGDPAPEWVKQGNGRGFYILHLDLPQHSAALSLGSAQPGILPPYQEGPKSWPLQFVLHFDPQRDKDKLYPLLITFADSQAAGTQQAFASALDQLSAHALPLLAANRDYYRKFLAAHTTIQTPDPRLNQAFTWAELSIDQLRVATRPDSQNQALIAGLLRSGDTARPGFGWFFGRDALWSLYAADSYGSLRTSRQEIEFLAQQQRADGKIMHELSQTASQVDWQALPYEWASADATPLFLMAANDYLRVSADHSFIESVWPHLQKAWVFETSHDADGDGIYDNAQGSGWVESWIPQMPHQEIYLAALDEQASAAFANLAEATGHSAAAQQARRRAQKIAQTIEREYYLSNSQSYAFSWNGAAGADKTASIFPAVAWWDGTFALQHPGTTMEDWASADFSTDWGVRDISDKTSFYDPISYHQGSVWPLFTGWASLAEYRAGHSLSGYAHLMQNANLIWAQDPGNSTELLSGRFYQALGRSTAHQLWSAAMVISPALRGLFGLEWNAAAGVLTVSPALPTNWNDASIRHLPFGSKSIDLTFHREGAMLVVRASDFGVQLKSRVTGARVVQGALEIPLPPVEVAVAEQLPELGAETRQLKVLDQQQGTHSLTLHLSAFGGTTQTLIVRRNANVGRLTAQGGQLGTATGELQTLHVRFDDGEGYVSKTVELTW